MSEYMDYNEWLDIEVKRLKEENEIQNKIIVDYREQNIELRDDIGQLKNELFNNYLHQKHQERLISELKIALSSYNNFVDEMFPD